MNPVHRWAGVSSENQFNHLTTDLLGYPNVLDNYKILADSWDEYFDNGYHFRADIASLARLISAITTHEFGFLNDIKKQSIMHRGITFKVYSKPGGTDHYFPFDLLPRIVSAEEWKVVERGLQQRMQALNLFLQDVYGPRMIFRDKRIPEQFLANCPGYMPQVQGIKPAKNVFLHVSGFDLIRNEKGQLCILEDNLRVPSGVSYLLENRKTMLDMLPYWFNGLNVHDVQNYPGKLYDSLQSFVADKDNPLIIVLTPGIYNSAWFEHAYLAREMHCPLVEPQELTVENHQVYWTSKKHGKRQVDVIYRRVDDSFMDPTCLREDSLLGVPGIVDVWRRGNIVLANALGNGVADDKAIYHYVPKMIEYYLGESVILPQIPTYLGANTADLSHIFSRMKNLVVKKVNQSGGCGMLIGPQATKKELEEFTARIRYEPYHYIAQPLIEFSTIPAWNREVLSPHRSDLRVFALHGANSKWILPGGLTRVALKENSYIVNSSQGGGSKDTWVMK